MPPIFSNGEAIPSRVMVARTYEDGDINRVDAMMTMCQWGTCSEPGVMVNNDLALSPLSNACCAIDAARLISS